MMTLVITKKNVMKSVVSFFAITTIVLFLSGCFWNTGKPALTSRTYVGTDRVLVMLLPPISGKGFYYETNGFIEAVRERGFEADLKILDVSPVLYLKGSIVELIKTELVDLAKASGYKRILLVGTSLGGHGALLYITKCPEDVDGVVVLAPFHHRNLLFRPVHSELYFLVPRVLPAKNIPGLLMTRLPHHTGVSVSLGNG